MKGLILVRLRKISTNVIIMSHQRISNIYVRNILSMISQFSKGQLYQYDIVGSLVLKANDFKYGKITKSRTSK